LAALHSYSAVVTKCSHVSPDLSSRGPTRHVMSGCVGSPTNGLERGRRVSGRGGASIGPSWASCEVSAELSIVSAASGRVMSGVMSGGGARSKSQVRSQVRLAANTVLRVIQGGRLIQAARLLRARFFGPRDGCRAKAQLLSGWVLGANAQPGSVLLWPAAATWSGKSRKLWGSWIAVREVGRRQRLCRVLMGRGCRQASATPGG